MKKEKKETKPYIKTKQKAYGGIEVELKTSPSKTVFGKILAITIAFLTVGVSIIGLIYLLTQV